jgi:hypothetical protein
MELRAVEVLERLEVGLEKVDAKLDAIHMKIDVISDRVTKLEVREDESRWRSRIVWAAVIGTLVTSVGAAFFSVYTATVK